MTLKDIAKEAGVSVSTVSRVINNRGSKAAGKEVQERIWEIVRKYNFVPNSAARNLKTGNAGSEPAESHALACIFARVPETTNEQFFLQLAHSVEQEAFKQNYFLKHSFSSFDLGDPATYRILSDNHVAGAVVFGRCDKPTLKFLRSNFNYVVYTGLNPIDADYDQIICNGFQAGSCVTDYLAGLGHRKIAYIGETSLENRYQGYLDALSKRRIAFNRDYIINTHLSMEGGYRGATELIRRKTGVSAVFCCNDSTAIGVLRAFQDAGIRVPEQISVISIDDIDTAQYLTPMLTTCHIPIEEMGQTAAKILIDRIQGGHKLPMKVSLPFRLVKRESCRKYSAS